MRDQVDFLDAAAIDWSNPAPGIFTKVLSRDPVTSARTALSRIDPGVAGFRDQPHAHAHEQTEEIFVHRGMLSFDSRVWLHDGGYVYHPAHYVHGFGSKVGCETSFVSRVSGTLNFRYFEQTDGDYPYFIGDAAASRPLSIVASPWAFAWTSIDPDGGICEYVYGADASSLEQTSLRRYRDGARDPAGGFVPTGYIEEYFVQAGMLEDEHGRLFGEQCFCCLLPGSARPRFVARGDALVYRSIFATGVVP